MYMAVNVSDGALDDWLSGVTMEDGEIGKFQGLGNPPL